MLLCQERPLRLRLLAAPVLLSLVAAAPASAPSAAEAASLAASKSWDDLFVKFLSAQPKDYSAGDRKSIAQALLQGAQATKDSDAVSAVSMAEKSVAFDESVAALLVAAEANQKIKENGQASREFERALTLDPKNNRAHLLRAELALAEGEPQVALTQLGDVAEDFDRERVQKDAQQARATMAERAAGQRALDELQAKNSRDAAPPDPKPAKGKQGKKGPKTIFVGSSSDDQPPERAPSGVIESGSDTGVGGLRQRANEHFLFSYGTNDRDWGQRADYEGHVMDALEEAYEFVGKTMRTNRTEKIQVVLYTKEEYDLHFGGTELSRAAGFFSGKIRINGAEEVTPLVRTVIVHEYTHAVIDELVHHSPIPPWVHEGTATWVENEYRYSEGLPGADDGWRTRLRGIARQGGLPKLAQLNQGFLGYSNPRLAYATAGEAIKQLVEQHGVETLVNTFRATTQAEPWAKNFTGAYGNQATLDDSIQEELSK